MLFLTVKYLFSTQSIEWELCSGVWGTFIGGGGAREARPGPPPHCPHYIYESTNTETISCTCEIFN